MTRQARLIETAGLNIIPAPTAHPDGPSITGAFAALRDAASHIPLGPDLNLADQFWTHIGPLRRGEIARQLAARGNEHPTQPAVIALCPTAIATPLLYGDWGSPLRVRGKVSAPVALPGPHLALLLCRGTPDGRVDLLCARAEPILGARRFFPVRSQLERDVLHVLIHLQENFDAMGLDLEICKRPSSSPSQSHILLSLRDAATLRKQVMLRIDQDGRGLQAGETGLLATPATLARGTLVSKLLKMLGA